jgi:O-antigen ligase
MVVSSGLPGLALALLAFLVQPLRDVAAAEARGADPALVAMLQQVWLFGLYLSGMETIFFDRNGPIWVTFVIAVFGLRYAACLTLRRHDPR